MQTKLYDFQQETVDNFKKWLARNPEDKEAQITYATGLGKTKTAIACIEEFLRANPTKKVLWVTHREDLIHQSAQSLVDELDGAYMGLKEDGKHLLVDIEQGKNYADPAARIIVASSCSIKGDRLLEFKKRHPDVDLIVFDEAHHSVARTWQDIRREFGGYVLNLTATPFNHGVSTKLDLGELLGERSLEWGVKNGYLVPTKDVGGRMVKIDYKNVNTFGHDYEKGSLSAELMQLPVVDKCTSMVLEHGKGRKRLLFGATVEHSKLLAASLRVKGQRVAEIYEDTPTETRREYYAQMKRGELDDIVNNLICTEGLDIPCIDMICNFRPTKSASLYLQMIGRGLRIDRNNPEKKECLILDPIDREKSFVKGTYDKSYLPLDLDVERHGARLGRPTNTLETFLSWFKEEDKLFTANPPKVETAMDVFKVLFPNKTFDAKTYLALDVLQKAMSAPEAKDPKDLVKTLLKTTGFTELEVFMQMMRYNGYFFCADGQIPKNDSDMESLESAFKDATIDTKLPTIKDGKIVFLDAKLQHFIESVPGDVGYRLKDTYSVHPVDMPHNRKLSPNEARHYSGLVNEILMNESPERRELFKTGVQALTEAHFRDNKALTTDELRFKLKGVTRNQMLSKASELMAKGTSSVPCIWYNPPKHLGLDFSYMNIEHLSGPKVGGNALLDRKYSYPREALLVRSATGELMILGQYDSTPSQQDVTKKVWVLVDKTDAVGKENLYKFIPTSSLSTDAAAEKATPGQCAALLEVFKQLEHESMVRGHESTARITKDSVIVSDPSKAQAGSLITFKRWGQKFFEEIQELVSKPKEVEVKQGMEL